MVGPENADSFVIVWVLGLQLYHVFHESNGAVHITLFRI